MIWLWILSILFVVGMVGAILTVMGATENNRRADEIDRIVQRLKEQHPQ